MKKWKLVQLVIQVLIIFPFFSRGAVTSYSNLLNDPFSVAQDFDDHSVAVSGMMGYSSGDFSVSSNRLGFTTSSSWLGIKTLKTQVGFSSEWSAQVDFHLNQLNNVVNGHWYDLGISIAMGADLFSAFPNRINLKAVQSGSGRKIGVSFYSGNVDRRGFENTTALSSETDGSLKMIYNPINKTIENLFKINGDSSFTSLGIIDLDQAPGWTITPTSQMNISIFAGSEPYQSVPSFPIIQSGDMYFTNFQIIPEPSALSLLAVGLGVVLRRRRRTV
jgi:hypothetical protein